MNRYLEVWFSDGDRAFFSDSEVSVDMNEVNRQGLFTRYNEKGHVVADNMPFIISPNGDRNTLKSDSSFGKLLTTPISLIVLTPIYDNTRITVDITETRKNVFVDLQGRLHLHLYKEGMLVS